MFKRDVTRLPCDANECRATSGIHDLQSRSTVALQEACSGQNSMRLHLHDRSEVSWDREAGATWHKYSRFELAFHRSMAECISRHVSSESREC